MRSTQLAIGEYYHIYNRGVDKRNIFMDQQDLYRFLQSLTQFNTEKPIGSLFRLSKLTDDRFNVEYDNKPLVDIVAYCLNPNHFHLIIRQLVEDGISQFMKRISGGYTGYFNERYERSGALFQGRYKFKHIGTDEYLKHLSAYVNLNYLVHKVSGPTAYLSSWNEYMGKSKVEICKKEIVLDQFKSVKEYKAFAKEALTIIKANKDDLNNVEFKKDKKLIAEQREIIRKVL